MKQRTYKGIKKQIREESAYGVGFYDGVFSVLPDYALVEAVKTMVSEGWVSANTDDGTVRNMLVTEAVKEMNYQDFKKAAPFFFSYPREQREKDLFVEPVEVSREFFEELQANREELFRLKREPAQSLTEKIEELETDRLPNGDKVVGVNMDEEKLLLLRSAENAYIDEWEVRREGLITDFRQVESSAYQTLTFLMQQHESLKPVFYEWVLNRDSIDGSIQAEKDVIQEISPMVIPDFKDHRSFYDYGQQFASFREEYGHYDDYVISLYERDYPTDYGLNFYAEAILSDKLDHINQVLAQEGKELLLYKGFGYSQGAEYDLAYIMDKETETASDAREYLEHEVTAYLRGSLTEVATISFDSISPEGGYDGVEERFTVDEERLGGDDRLVLSKLKQLYPECQGYQLPEDVIAKEESLGQTLKR